MADILILLNVAILHISTAARVGVVSLVLTDIYSLQNACQRLFNNLSLSVDSYYLRNNPKALHWDQSIYKALFKRPILQKPSQFSFILIKDLHDATFGSPRSL